MYLVGASHPNKYLTVACLERLAGENCRLVTSVEVIQEILHRYTSINRRDAISPAVDALYGLVDEVFSVSEEAVLKAKDLVLAYTTLSARVALHLAVMKLHKVSRVLTFDRGFEAVSGISLISP